MESSCLLKFKESTSNNRHTKKQKILQNCHSFIKKKYGKPNFKYFKESLKWYCQVCGLVLSSKVQAQEHFFGKRHQNVVKSKDFYNRNCCPRLKLDEKRATEKKNLIVLDGLQNSSKTSFNQNLGLDYETCDSDNIIPPPAGRDNILETVIKSEKKTFYSSDLSIYRTPSGKYYCQPCNITVNSQVQFLQHLESRKHKHKASKSSLKVK